MKSEISFQDLKLELKLKFEISSPFQVSIPHYSPNSIVLP